MRAILGPIVLIVVAGCASGQPDGRRTDAALLGKIDSIVNRPIAARKVAGASVAVVRGNDTIAVKGYGRASIELDVPTPSHAVYEIGSITKQFTGAAIMQLVEQGKIDLDADVTRHLPGYNTQGRKIPVRRLTDHTSGIKGYTELPEFWKISDEDLPKDTLVKLFSRKPFDFEPGDEQIYNNSAFFLLGLIIEKVSGKSYPEYVKGNLFDRAGMHDAHYCSERVIHEKKVEGYDSDSTGLILKGPLVHTWPFSAGSLCASAVDLVAWNRALHGGKILSPESYREFITPGKLNDGTQVRYAKGILVSPVLGHRAYHHGGGINGFTSENIYFPDESLSIVVLYNTAGPEGPSEVARAIAELVLGKPGAANQAFSGDPSAYTGNYAGHGRGRPTELTISAEGSNLLAKARFWGDSARPLVYVSGETFQFEDIRFTFIRNNGKATGLNMDTGGGFYRLARK